MKNFINNNDEGSRYGHIYFYDGIWYDYFYSGYQTNNIHLSQDKFDKTLKKIVDGPVIYKNNGRFDNLKVLHRDIIITHILPELIRYDCFQWKSGYIKNDSVILTNGYRKQWVLNDHYLLADFLNLLNTDSMKKHFIIELCEKYLIDFNEAINEI